MAFMLPAFFSKIGAFIVGNWAKIKAAAYLATFVVGVKGYRQAQDMLAQSQAILGNKNAAGGKIPVVYGTRRVGAQVVYMDVNANNSRDLYVVYALSVGECDEILGRTIELDGNRLTDSARFRDGGYIGSDKISSGAGSLNTVSQNGGGINAGAGQFGTSPTSKYRYVMNLHHGAASQTADPMLVASMSNWTFAHRLDGICYIAAHYNFDNHGMWSGVPQLTVQVRGKKVYDPRSGETAFTDSTGKVIGDNPALCFLDYITNDEYGKGLTTSQINMTTFGAAATVCETQVDQPYFNGTAQSLTWSANSGDKFFTIAGADANEDWWQNKIGELLDLFDANGNGVIDGDEIVDVQRSQFFNSTAEYIVFINNYFGSSYASQIGSSLLKVKRFHCNGYLDTNKNVMENARELLANMRGIFLYINGKYELSIEDTGSSTFSINDNHIIADAGISVDYGNKDKKANKVIVEFFNANKGYELDTATVLHDATPEYYSDDNDEILEIKAEFPYVTDPYIAYNMGKAILTRSRNQTTMQFLGTPEMYKLNVGDIVDLTYAGLGFSGKVCRVEALELQPNGLVAVSLIEYFDVYTWEVPPQEPVEELANLPSAYAVKAPTNITFTDTNSSSTGRPFLSWDEPTDFPDYQYRVNVVDNSGNQVINRIVDVENCDLNFVPTGSYVANITSLNTLGTESSPARFPASGTFTIGDAPTDTADIQNDAITTPKILDGNVTDAKINSLTANKLTAGTIDASVITVTNLDADNITSGTLDADTVTVSGGDVTINSSGITINGSSSSINLGSGAFTVSSAGVISATSGEVGGFTLGATSLTNTAADSKIQIGTSTEIFTVDGNGIYLGNGTFANAPFKVLNTGEVQTTKSFTAGVAGTNAIAKMSGTGDYRFWSGNETPSNASFSVDKDGKAIAKNLVLKLTDGTVYFDSATGFSSSALSQISLTTGTKVTTISSTFDADTEYEEITVTQNTTVNVSVSIDTSFGGNGDDGSTNTAIDESEAEVPENFTLTIQHSSDGGSSYATVVTDTFTRVNDRLNPKVTPASDEYKINTETEQLFIGGQGGVIIIATTTTSLNLGCVDSDGRTILSYSGLSLSGISTGTTHRIKATVSTTDTSYDTTNNNVSSTAPRVVSVTDPSGDGFYVGDSSGSQVAPAGDITRVQITTASNSGLTGGANYASGDALFTLALASSIDGAKTFTNNVVIQGDLDVQGTTTTIDTTNLDVKDKNITLNYGTGDTSANANGAGITIQDAVNSTTDATLTWNTSNDSFNFSHNLNFADNVKAQFGTSNYLQIYHDGSHSHIINVTGDLTIDSQGDDLILKASDDFIAYVQSTDIAIQAIGDGKVGLRYNNVEKLATTSTGIQVGTFSGNSVAQISAGTTGISSLYLGDGSSGAASYAGFVEYNHTGDYLRLGAGSAERVRVNSTGIDVTGDITLGDTNPTITFNDSSVTNLSHTILSSSDNLRLAVDVNGVDAGSRVEIFDGSTEVARFSAGAMLLTGTATMDGLTVDGDAIIQDATPTLEFKDTDNNLIASVGGASGSLVLKADTGGGTSGESMQFHTGGVIRQNISAGGDISFYEDTGTTAKFFWDASAESLSIGTTSPASSATLHLRDTIPHLYIQSDDGQSGKLLFGDATDNSRGGFEYTSSDAMIFMTNNLSEKMRIDSAGRLLVGTTSVGYSGIDLTVGDTTDSQNGVAIQTSTTGYGYLLFGDGSGVDAYRGQISYKHGDDYMYMQTAGAERMRIDSSGNVGISEINPSEKLAVAPNTDVSAEIGKAHIGYVGHGDYAGFSHIDQNAGGSYALLQGASGQTFLNAATGQPIYFRINNSNIARFDSSGNLLVGTTSESTWETVAGFRTRQSGSTTITRDGNPPLYVNRLTSDGDITVFKKGTATVGSIGTNSNTIYIDGSAANTGLQFAGSTIAPRDAGALNDGGVDLGTSSYRFKDLYLSGTARSNTVSINGTTVIDASRNLTNIGTISSGAITTSGHIQQNNGYEIRSKDTGGSVRTIMRVNGSNELEYGWSGNGKVKIMGGGSYTERFSIGTDGNATFSGSISSGAVANIYTSSDRGYFVAGTNDASNQHLYFGSYHGTTLKELTFSGSNNGFYPQTDASIDLGLSSKKFKSLYLSGNAYSATYRKDGDSDTYLNFPAANQLSLVGGGATILKAYQIAGAYGVLEAYGSGSATYPNYTFNGDSNTGMYLATTDTLGFTTGGSEKMRIDSSGNLLVGKTSDNNALAGTTISNSGIVKVTRTDWSLLLNRLTTDGEIALFQKDGASVGSIGVSGGNNIYISGTQTNHAGLTFATDAILPTRQEVGIDNVTDLGASSERFKDLYLSGTARSNTVSINGTTVIDSARAITSTALFSNNISTSPDKIGNIKIARVNGAISSIDNLDTFIFSKTDSGYPSGTKPAGSHNGTAIISFQTHTDNYYTQLALSTNTNDLFIRSANNSSSFGSYSKLLKENFDITVGTISSGAITSTGDISGATIEGYVFPSYPSQSGGVLTSTASGDMAWSFNTVSSYVDSGDNRLITSTGSTGIQGEYGLTYSRTDGLQVHNYDGSGGLTSDATLTIGKSNNNSGISELILDSQTSGTIKFQHGTTTDASIGYEGVFNNILSISCGNGITFGSSNLTTTGTINSGAITSGAITSSGKLEINQAGNGTSNVPSGVAEFSGASYGGVVKALSLVNSVTAALGNGTQLAFHNASNYSPTGTITVTQAGDTTTDSKMEFQIYRNGLITSLTIDHDSNATFASGIFLTDANTKLSKADTGTNRLNIQTNSGYLQIGPGNTGFNHFITDRATNYFNTRIQVDTGLIGSYNEDLYLQRAGVTKLTLGETSATFTGTINSGAITSSGVTIVDGTNDINLYLANTSYGIQLDYSAGDMFFRTNGGTRLTIANNGNATFSGTINSGAITSTGNVTAYSDERLKENIQTLDGKKALQMRGVSFTKDGKEGSGVIAQELEKVAPELVQDGEYKSVAYGNLVGYLIEAIKDQQNQIDELKARLDNDSSN